MTLIGHATNKGAFTRFKISRLRSNRKQPLYEYDELYDRRRLGFRVGRGDHRRRRRRSSQRAVREQLRYNEGMACFARN